MYSKSPQLPYSLKRLESYAKWYYERYFPSVEALREKLLRKCENNDEQVDSVLAKVREIFIEELLIDQHVRNLIDSHKNEKTIRQTLKKKKFELDLVDKKIEEYREDMNRWEAHEGAIIKKWNELDKKGKSQKVIIQMLIENFPHFRDEIHALKKSDEDTDIKNLELIYLKLCKGNIPETYTEKQKIAAKLMQRGFGYDKIKSFLFGK